MRRTRHAVPPPIMTCASCGRTNRDDSRFCVGCGTALIARCPACGREAESDARFCGGCGSSLAAPPPAPPAPPATPPAEAAVARKTVTIVFADLAGSTALHERLDAESARAFMDRYYRALHAVVDAHGGTVVKLLGDGVMVAFGVPRVAEDDAIRAVRAAVGMHEAFRTLADGERAAPGTMGLRVAVNTGEVVVSGANDDVVGDPVNVAARLQQEAADGDVLIGEATRRLVSDLVTLELVGTLTLKGRAETVAAHRVVSLDRPAGAPALAFVGRDDELRRLTAVYDAAVAAPAARLAVVLGSPGLGKSRLVGELVRRLGDSVTVVSAHCDATGGATFAPLADGIRALLQLDTAAGGDVVHAAIADRMGAGAPDRTRIAAGVTALLAGTPAAPEETFFVVRRFLAALAAAQPVVLLIDDLQWAEPLLLDLVEHLVQWGTDVPLLLLVAARPELRDARSSLAVPGAVVSDVVTLAGLDAGAATRLAANAIGADALPAAVAGRVLAISEGNPLFVGELVRMLVQDGALKREGDRWTTAVDLSTLAMPPTIHALLAARIERLRSEERMVLERAAVVGRQFSRAAIAHLLPREVADLDARLESLRRSELIEPHTGWFLGEPALTFHHGLIRDAAYRRILKGTRAELHERFADWLASRVGAASIEHDETMGWHLEQAHQHLRELGPIDAHGRALGERAARHLTAAGRRALERDDLPLAGSLLGRAVERLDAADPTRADLALDWCEALLTAGDVGPAATAVAELGRFTAGSERLGAWHTCFAGQLAALTDPATLRRTVETVTGAATTLASLDDAAGEAKAHAVHATALARLGEIGACEAALDRALAAARRASDRRRANAVLAGAPVAALWGPSPVTRASGRCLDVVRVLRITQGAPAVEAVALRCQAVLEALRGRAEAARRMIAASRKLVEELGITQRLLEAEVATGLIELLEGDAVAAERALHPAYDGLRRQGLGIDAAQAAALLGRAILAQDRAAEAEALSHESELLAGDDLKAAIAWRGVRAEALARRGEHGEAIALARAAVGIAAATDALLDHADARLALAAALRAAGKGAEADAEEARAIGLWEAKGAVLLAGRARGDGTRLDPAAHARNERIESASPVRRPVRANAATANIARIGAAIDARNADEFLALLADDFVGVHHATGLTYDRTGARARLHALFDSEDLVIAHDPVATLGDTLALFRMSMSSSRAAGKKFDVGPWEHESIDLIEVDGHARRRRFEQFADDRLGSAIARLYERYAELLPEGPERTHAAATARSVAAHMAPFDLERLATTFAPDIEVVDRRTVGFGTLHGAATLRPALQSFLDLIDDFAWRPVDVLALEAHAFLLRYVGSGTERVSGLPYERTQLELMLFGADGLVTRWERFEVEHAEAALARFDTLVGSDRAAPTLRRVRANAATAGIARLSAAVRSRNHAALDALAANAFTVVHHPLGVTFDWQEIQHRFRLLFQAEGFAPSSELLAVLGDSLALTLDTTSFTGWVDGDLAFGAAQSIYVGLWRTDARGRFAGGEVFAATRLGDAVARLYERHADLLPDGPARTRAAATARAVAAMVAPPDLDRYASALAPDVAFVDHRTVGFASGRGADSLLRGFRSLLDLADDVTTRVDDVLRLEPGALLLRWTITGIDRASGGAFESEFLLLWVFGPDGRVVRDETFDAHRAAEAAARFDALAARAGTTSTVNAGATTFANAATESTRRIVDLWEARDWSGLLEALPPEFRYVDRRPMAQLELDRAGYVEFIRQLGDMGSVHSDAEVLATRGDRLALGRMCVEVAEGDVGPSEVEFLDVIETNERGETVARIRFDPADLDAAYAELDARFEAGEAAAHPLAAAWLRAFPPLVATRDWDAMAARCAPTFVAHDHRLVSWGTVNDGAAWVDTLRALVELAPDAHYRMIHLRMSDRGWLVQGGWVGTREGGPFEIATISVSEVDDHGRVLRNDVYELTQLDQALARFAEIASAPAVPPEARFANAATRAWGQAAVRYQARDWSGTGHQLYSERFRYTDRRRMALLDLDREGFAELTRHFGNMSSVDFRHEVLATRGERLALVHIHLVVADADVGPSEVVNLNVIETDEHGQCVNYVRFDPDDLDAAYAELEARFEAGEGARYPAAMAANRARLDAFARRDWGALTAVFAPTFAVDDHRLLGWGTTLADRATYVRSQEATAELAPDSQVRIEHLRISDSGFFARVVVHGTRDGGVFETPLLLVAEVDGAGLILRYDVYDVDDYERACARFDTLTAKAPLRVPTPFVPKPNAATAASDRMRAAFHARDWAAMRALGVPGAAFEDRRRQVLIGGDVDFFVADMRGVAEGTSLRFESFLVGTAGARVALERQLWTIGSADAPSEIENLTLVAVDEAGLITAWLGFDVADELVARREALERWLAIDPVAAVVVGTQLRFIDAWNACDRARVRATLADDLVVDDHRRTGLGRIDDVEVYVDSIVALWELAPDARLETWPWLAVEPHGSVFVLRRSGRLPDGGAFESEYVGLNLFTRGLCSHLEMFELDAVDAALARFAELRPDLLRIPPNAATRANDRYHAFCRARDWDGLRAHYHPACVFENRRRLLRSSGGIEMAIANARHLWELPGVDAERAVLAAPGDRLSLEHWRFTGREDDVLLWERESLIVLEVDAEGRTVAVIIFDVEDRAAASDELAERHARVTFPPPAADRAVEVIRARRSRDLVRIRAALPAEFHLDDHRRTGLGRIAGAEAYTAALAALFELSPDVTVGHPLHYLAEETYGALSVVHTFGALNDGGAFESVFLVVVRYGNDGPFHFETFELEDIARARARFAELRPDPLRLPKTMATRAVARSLKAMRAGDADALRALVRDDFVFEDRSKRALVRGDIETWIGSMEFTMALPEIRFEMELLATLGERLALQRLVAKGGRAGGEFELLHRVRLFEVDAAGTLGAVILFDLDDRTLAFAEALERFAAGEAGETAGVAPFAAFMRACAVDDWETVRRTLAPDFVFDDRRTHGVGRLDRDQWIASLQTKAARAPGVAEEVRRVLAWNRHAVVVELRIHGPERGTDDARNDGGPFESVFLNVVMTDGDVIRSSTLFDARDADRALAWFAEQTSTASVDPSSA